MALGRLEPSEEIHKALLKCLNSSELATEGFKAEVAYHIALSLFHRQRYAQAHNFAKAALKHCTLRKADVEIESSFESFQEIKSRLETLTHQLVIISDKP